ncbi:MAG: ATP-binding protein [Ureaplasma sp.]|nr:ATP-binding protein [Ureaplasma sp.]
MNKLLVKNINIIQWRGLHNLKLDFNENYNEICGKNGSGKSSILDLIKYMLFDTKNLNKYSKNINSSDLLPNVDIDLSFNNEIIHLHTQKDEWFIDGVHFNTKIDYQKSLSQRLGLKDINDIKSNIFPNLLEDIFLTNKQDSKEGRDELMSILEPKLSSESRCLVKNGGLKFLFTEIYSLEEEIKQKNKMIKEKNYEIRSFKEHNKEILDWNTDNLNNIDKEIIENNKIISNYENVENKIANLRSEKIKLENDLDNKKEFNKSQDKLKLTAFQILLIVLTFGIYFLILKSKFKNENQISEYNWSIQYKQIESEINKIQNEINSLMHDKNYENVDIELLRNKKRDLDSATANHSSYLAKKQYLKNIIQN